MAMFSVRADEKTLEAFAQFCDRNGMNKQEGFKALVEAVCMAGPGKGDDRSLAPSGQAEDGTWYEGGKKEFLSHLSAHFREFGGELRKESCFYANEKYVAYVVYRRLSDGESKIVKAPGKYIKALEETAQATGRTPLVAVYVILSDDSRFYTLLPLANVKQVEVEPGRRNAGDVVFRRENGAEHDSVYVHVRGEADAAGIRTMCEEKGTLPAWFETFYIGVE